MSETKKFMFNVAYPIEAECRICAETGEEIMLPESMDLVESTARRLKAAMNACAGIPTEALEKGAVKELLEACKYAFGLISIARKYFPKTIRNPDKFQLENACATLGRAIGNTEAQ